MKQAIKPKFIHMGDIVRIHHTYFDQKKPPNPDIYTDWEIVNEDGSWGHEWKYTGRLIRNHHEGNEITHNLGKEMAIDTCHEGMVVIRSQCGVDLDELNQDLTTFFEDRRIRLEKAFSRIRTDEAIS